jgi:hypothetical protein
MTFAKLTLSGAAILFPVAMSQAMPLFVNGSFEDFTNPHADVVITTAANTTLLPGWTLETSTGSTDVCVETTGDRSIGAIAGSHYFTVNSAEAVPGILEFYQDVTTVAGTTYNLTFTTGRIGPGDGTIGFSADVLNIDGGISTGSLLTSLATATSSVGGEAWNAETSVTFTATGSTTRIQFNDISNTTSSVDAVIDNVSLAATAVPEPSTYAAIGGMVALLGTMFIKRRK